MRKITFILAIVILNSFAGCGLPQFSATEEVTFVLPSTIPDSFLYWKIDVNTTDYSTTFNTSSGNFKLILKKNHPYSLQAYPVITLTDGSAVYFYKPAGTIYPYAFNSTSRSQSLTWENGYSAELINRLIKGGLENNKSNEQILDYVTNINWQKLMYEITENSKKSTQEIIHNKTGKFFNPWLLDTTRILENLSNHIFSSSYLDGTNLYTVSTDILPADVLSPYIPQNQILKETDFLTLRKNTPELLLCNNFYGAYVYGTNSKNLSVQWVYMPIIKEAL